MTLGVDAKPAPAVARGGVLRAPRSARPRDGDTPEDALAGSGAMFDRIARRYDLLNRILSVGLDQRWRVRTAQALRLRPTDQVLDVATGTADLAVCVAKLLRAHRGGARAPGAVVGLDPSPAMLAIGAKKLAAQGLSEVTLREGDAQALPFDDAAFDAATIAFGIRNVPDRSKALRELARVLRPGGRLAILELGMPHRGLLAALARFHVQTVVPWLGALLSGAWEYRYLQRSIAAFPPPELFADLMRACGFEEVSFEPLTFGACHLYIATNGSVAIPGVRGTEAGAAP